MELQGIIIVVGILLIYAWATATIQIKTKGKIYVTIQGQDHRVDAKLVKVGVDGDPHRIAPKSGGEYFIEEDAVGWARYPFNWPDFMRTTVPTLYFEKDNPHPIRLLQSDDPAVSANSIRSMFDEGFLRTMLKDAEENFNKETGKVSPQKITMYAAMASAGASLIGVYLIYQLTNQMVALQSVIAQAVR